MRRQMVTTMYNNRLNWTPLSPITITYKCSRAFVRAQGYSAPRLPAEQSYLTGSISLVLLLMRVLLRTFKNRIAVSGLAQPWPELLGHKGNKPVKMTYFLPPPPPNAMLMSGIEVIFGQTDRQTCFIWGLIQRKYIDYNSK